MAAYVIWIDSQEAKIWHLKPGGIEQKHLEATGPKHPAHPHGKADRGHHPDAQKLYHAVATGIAGASEILVVGPGEAKTQFKSHLETHHHGDLAKKIVGVEAVDTHLTEPQILAMARRFFKARDLFN